MIANFPSCWAMPRLGEICEINPRSKPDLALDDEVSFIPMSAVDERSGKIVAGSARHYREVMKGYTPFIEGDVLFAKITPCMENGKAAIARGLVNGVGYGSTEFYVLRHGKLVLAEWIFFFLRMDAVRMRAAGSFQGAVGQQRVPESFLTGFRVPLPPVGEQHRILDFLREAEAIVALRQNARVITIALFSAIFEDLFRDLLMYPGKYDSKPLSELLLEIQTGWSPSAEDRPAHSDEWGVLKLSAVTLGHYAEGEHKALPSALTPREKLEIKPGDLLLTRKNTKELVGAAAFIWETRPKLMFSDLIFRLKVKSEAPVHPKFLWALFSHPSFRPRISQLADGASGSMPNIPKSRLEKLSIPTPPSDCQRRFLAVIDELHSLETTLRGEAAVADELIPSLHSRAFTGELTRVWRQHHQPELEREAKARDKALTAVGSLSKPLSAEPTVKLSDVEQADGDYSGLTRDQQRVLEQMDGTRRKRQPLDSGARDEGKVRTADSIASVLVGPLHDNVQAVESNLAVLVACGLVTALSLEQRTPDTDETVYGNCYRLPVAELAADGDEGVQSSGGVEGTRDQEILRLLDNRKREETAP
jgi:type I restriction enzyme, S subunit